MFSRYLDICAFVKFRDFEICDVIKALLHDGSYTYGSYTVFIYRYNFRDTVDLICSCGAGSETTDHQLLLCQNFALVQSSFLNTIFKINVEFRNMNDLILISLSLFGSEKHTFNVNTKILILTIQFLKGPRRFDEPLNMIIMSNLDTYRCILFFRTYNHLIFLYSFSCYISCDTSLF